MSTWEENLSIGEPTLDTQRRQLLLMALRTCRQIERESCSNADITNLLFDFAACAAHCFSTEERLLAALDYPERDAHASLHAHFTESLVSSIARLNAGEIDRDAVRWMLEDKLIQHILVADAAVASFCSGYRQDLDEARPRRPCA